MAYLPHKNKDLWDKTKELFKITPNNITELNEIFFKGNCPFFEEIDKNYKKEGEDFLGVYKYLQKLALNLENILPVEITLLKKGSQGRNELTRKEVALIFLLSFFNLIDLSQEKDREISHFAVYEDLISLEYRNFEFGRCFLNYLTNIGKWLSKDDPILKEKIKYIRDSKGVIDYDNFSETKLCEIKIYEKGSLFDGETSYYVDFANMFIGGGVLEGKCAQEETLFASHTEAIVAMFFMEAMDDNDAIRIDNIIQYSNYEGYGSKFKYKGSCIDKNTNLTIIKRKKIIAIDAIIYYSQKYGLIDQRIVERDIHKAYVGFNLAFFEKDEEKEIKSIATGNWGCGAFRGDPELKFLQQWVAASLARIQRLDYYTNESNKMKNIIELLKAIKKKYKTANELYKDLVTNNLSEGEVLEILLNNEENYDFNLKEEIENDYKDDEKKKVKKHKCIII